ncbi:putative transcriptional regulator, LysR family protein [Mycolicibacterium madagascariense]|uniref:Putative transcriptional regulator, LysR family protein n=1 Tax=Mycolicibacterium madagascariense TaxID=212765 RepID=A0A7I7XI63_9MYCO|nr:LysR family transcriptional regulator [Mycolicibacterium madagascariense]MCV7012777.1 LysR family transcriptional regulator [Mycolicibacterium madagascariense]BBZ28888.1 putative transcriptional regulator, LysR family protein [Mycolicibacterium madagascariense]
MDVERLRLLRDFGERGTVQATADALSMTSSAVSQQLKRLQKEAGVDLLEPYGRRVRLTEAGRALLACADEVLAALDHAEAEMDAFRTTPRGAVRVAMVPSAASMLLPALIVDAAAVGVDVIARDVDQPTGKAPELLADHDVVVVDRDDRDTSNWGPRVRVAFLLREPLDLVLRKDHHLAGAESIALHELAHCPWISVEIGRMGDDVMRSLAVVSGVQPRIVQRINDFRVVEELVLAGVGIALLPRHASTIDDLIRRPVNGINVARRVDAITRISAERRPAVAAVLDILRRISALKARVNGGLPSRANGMHG